MSHRLALLFFACTTVHAAEVPRLLGHEGRLLRADGSPERGVAVLTFALYTTGSGGSAVWTETHTTSLSAAGYYSVQLGRTSALPAFDTPPYWLGVTVAGESEMTPRAELATAAFALRAAKAERVEIETRGTGTLAASTGQWVRLATVDTVFSSLLRVSWTSALFGGACCGHGTLLARIAKQSQALFESENFFQTESLHHHNSPVFTRARMVNDQGYHLELFVPAGVTPGMLTVTLVEVSGLFTLLAPAYSPSVAPVVIFDVGIGNAAFVAGASDTKALSLLHNGNVGIGTTAPAVKLDVAGPIRAIGTGGNVPHGCVQRTATDTANTTSISVGCAAGEIVTGGGCGHGTPYSLRASYPSGQGWVCAWLNSNTDIKIAYAICCAQ